MIQSQESHPGTEAGNYSLVQGHVVPHGEQPTVNNLIGPGEPLKFLARDGLDPATYPSQQYCAVVSRIFIHPGVYKSRLATTLIRVHRIRLLPRLTEAAMDIPSWPSGRRRNCSRSANGSGSKRSCSLLQAVWHTTCRRATTSR